MSSTRRCCCTWDQIIPVAVGFGFVALLVYPPLYFQGVKGYSPLQAVLGMMPLTVPILFVPVSAGRLAARIPVRIMLTAGLVLVGLGALRMSGIRSDTRALAIGLGITGIGTRVTFGLMNNLAVSVVPADRSGMAAGIFSTMRIAGEMIAITLMGLSSASGQPCWEWGSRSVPWERLSSWRSFRWSDDERILVELSSASASLKRLLMLFCFLWEMAL